MLNSLKYIVPLFFLRCHKLYITLANGLTTSGKTNHGSNVQVEISSSLEYGTSYPQLIYLYLSRLTRLEYTILWTHFNLTLYMKTIPLIFVCPCIVDVPIPFNVICDWICKKGSSTHIQFTNFDNSYIDWTELLA